MIIDYNLLNMKELYTFTAKRKVKQPKGAAKEIPCRIVFAKPNKVDLEDADFFYSQKYNDFINLGFLTRAMLNKKMGDNGGMHSKEAKEELTKLIKEYNEATKVVEFFGGAKDLDEEQQQQLDEAKNILIINQKLIMDYENAMNQQYAHTADAKAEGKLYEFLIFNFSYYEEVVDGAKELFPIFEGDSYDEKRSFFLAISEDEEDVQEDLLKARSIYDASFAKLINVITVWWRGLANNQEEIDKILKSIESVNEEGPAKEKEVQKKTKKKATAASKAKESQEEEPEDEEEVTQGE